MSDLGISSDSFNDSSVSSSSSIEGSLTILGNKLSSNDSSFSSKDDNSFSKSSFGSTN